MRRRPIYGKSLVSEVKWYTKLTRVTDCHEKYEMCEGTVPACAAGPSMADRW